MENKLGPLLELLGVFAAIVIAGLLSASLWEHYRLRGDDERGMDTIVVRDTVYYATPVASDSVVMRYETVRVPIYRPTDTVRVTDTVMCSVPQTDSVKVQLPIVQRTYGDSLYTAWVSGYDARLDSIRLYTRSQYSFKARDKPRRWGVGIGAGVGFVPKHGVQPYIGIGIQYNLIRF